MSKHKVSFAEIVPEPGKYQDASNQSPSAQKYTDSGTSPTFVEQDVPTQRAVSPSHSDTASGTESLPDHEIISSFRDLREIIPAADGAMSPLQIALMTGSLGGFAAAVFFFMSGVNKTAYGLYFQIMGMENLSLLFIIMGLITALMLHAIDFYRWRIHVKVMLGSVILYGCLIGCACNAKKYPSALGLVVMSQAPIMLFCLRIHSARFLKISAHSFFQAAVVIYFLIALLTLIGFTIWVVNSDMMWGIDTKLRLYSHIQDAGIFERYGIRDWNHCRDERSHGTRADEKVLNHCSRIELTAFLIYGCPLVSTVVHFVFGCFCILRLRIMERGASVAERNMRLIVFLLLTLFTAFWIACSTAGASMGLSRAMLGAIGLSCVCFVVWLLFVVDLEDLLQKAKGTVIFKLFEPAVRSDYFAALILCLAQTFMVTFFCMEFFVRQLERIRGVNPSGGPFLTSRGEMAMKVLRGRHWAITLEKTFNLCMLYLVLFLCSRFTPVFLSWLGEELKEMQFLNVCIIFYIVGLTMFLLPPVPGVPVYIAAGAIIVPRGKQEDWLDFYTGVAFASVFGLILKLNAVAMQQKLIGEAFGRSLYIQQLVGVHTISIRAIEKILKRPGMTVEKVAILCGGPDWPTSVLTGILRLSLPQMLMGTLPCFFLIIPCVLGGSSLNEPELRNLSPLLIMMVGVTQGGMFLAAMVFIAKETERSHEELSQPLPQHALLLEKAEQVAKSSLHYKSATRWCHLSALQKWLLSVSVMLELIACSVCFFAGGICYRNFSIGNDFEAGYEDGGLNGEVHNMVKDPGYVVFGAILTGFFFLIMYKCLTGRGAAKCEIGPCPE